MSHSINFQYTNPPPILYPVNSGFSCRNAMLWRERNHCEWQIALPLSMLIHVSLMSKRQMTSLPLFWQETLGTLGFINEMVTRMQKAKQQPCSCITLVYSSLPFLHNYTLAMPNFAFYGERKQTLTKFIFLLLHLNMVLKNSTPVGFTFNWQRKSGQEYSDKDWVQIYSRLALR